MNDSGGILGQYCYPQEGGCVYILGLRNRCTKGNQYPVLVNADTGSKSVKVYCNGRLEIGRYQYVFTEFEEIHRAVLAASRIGFAFPLEGDEFIVVRFSLIGSNEAIAAMEARTPNPNRRDTRDQRL
jgi:hypothetical protein